MLQLEPGTWYVVVTCEKCISTIFLFPDLNHGKRNLRANYIVTCPHCAHKGGYQAHHYLHSEPNYQLALSEA